MRMNYRSLSTAEISTIIGVELIGENRILNGLNLINRNSEHDLIITYASSEKYINKIRNNNSIKAIILTSELYEKLKDDDYSFFISENPETCFYDLHIKLFEEHIFYHDNNKQSIIADNLSIHKSVIVESNVTIGKNVKIGQNTVIKSGSVIGDNTIIGSGTVIGSEGFQAIVNSEGKTYLIPHAGGCIIGQNVYVGDNVTICNSLFENTTKISDGTKIDNLVHIAHNCIIGENCVITAGTILCGSVIIENNVWIAPNVTILNKVIVKSNSFIGLGSVVLKNVIEGTKVFGNPARKIN